MNIAPITYGNIFDRGEIVGIEKNVNNLYTKC